MENYEMIEKLVEKADVTYEEAKGILESVNWNLLDALIALEKEGRIKKPEQASYTTKQNISEEAESIKNSQKPETFFDYVKKFLNWIKNIILKGMDNYLCITDRKGKKSITMPLTLLAIFTVIAFWFVIVVLVLEFFQGCSFSIEGPDFGTDKVNDCLSKIKYSKDKKEDEVEIINGIRDEK